MNRRQMKGLMVLSALLGAAGLFLLFGSANFGRTVAEQWLASQFEGIDTSLYGIILQGNINNFLAAGSILFAVGLVSLIFLYYKSLSMEE